MTSELWLSSEATMNATGWSERTLRIKAEAGEVRWRSKDVQARGRKPREYAASSLPTEAQRKVFQQQLVLAASSSPATAAGIPVPADEEQQPSLFSPTQMSAGTAPRILVHDEHRTKASARHDAIAPLLDWIKRGYRPTHLANADGSAIRTVEQLVDFLAQHHHVSSRTIWRWYKKFDERGFGALANKTRQDRQTSRFFEKHPKAAQFVQAKFLHERLSYAVTYEALVREWPSLYNHGSIPPSYTTVRTYLDKLIPKAITVVAREGERGYNSKIEAFKNRDFDSIAVNQIWVSDHRIFDVFRYNDCFLSEEPYAALRIWHTMILDMRSRKLVGWSFSANPSSRSIASALHMAVSQYGCPKTFYVDNGKDYKKIGKEESDYNPINVAQNVEGFVRQLGIEVQHCLVKHPQSKLVESFFSGQSKRFDVLYQDAYAGRKPALRPEACQDLLDMHRKWRKGMVAMTPLRPGSEFIAEAEQWMKEYNDRAHSGRGMDGRSPNQVFDEGCPSDARRIPNLMKLAPLFWDRELRKVGRGGTVERFKQTFEPVDALDCARMTEMIGRDVVIACDPNDIGEAVVCDQLGNPLAKVRAQELVAHGPISREAIQSSLRERRSMLKAIRRYIQFVAGDVPTEIELLRRRAGYDDEAGTRILPPATTVMRAGGAAAAAAAVPAYKPLQHEDAAERLLKLAEEN